MSDKIDDSSSVSDGLKYLVHNLFLDRKYTAWVNQLTDFEPNRWFSVIVELDKCGSSIEDVKSLGQTTYSKLVFRCIPSPTWNKNNEIIVLFTLAGSQWSSTVNYEPANQ